MDILSKKSIILSVRMRFSPESQPLRELAIEKVIEQNMVVADVEKGLSVHEIEQLCDIFLDKRLVVFGRKVIERAVQRLKHKRRLVVVKTTKAEAERYRLSDEVQKECDVLAASARIRNSRVVERLFAGTPEAAQYAQPFFECIALVFSRLGEAYVRLLKGEVSPKHIVSLPDIEAAVKLVSVRNKRLEASILKGAVDRFLMDPDADYDVIKWNMSQNYFIAKTLGLNASDILLSQELFSNSVLYLDTIDICI